MLLRPLFYTQIQNSCVWRYIFIIMVPNRNCVKKVYAAICLFLEITSLKGLPKDKLYIWTGDSLRFSEICYWQNYQKMTLISFVDLWKKICFPKFEDCSPKIKSATVILSLIFSRAWQSYFLCHTHAFLKNCVFFYRWTNDISIIFLYLCSKFSKLVKADFLFPF